jgi:hypothetical protein
MGRESLGAVIMEPSGRTHLTGNQGAGAASWACEAITRGPAAEGIGPGWPAGNGWAVKKPLAKPLRRQSRANRLAFSMFGLTEKAGRAHANRVPPGEADFPSVTRPIPLEDELLDPRSAVTWRE